MSFLLPGSGSAPAVAGDLGGGPPVAPEGLDAYLGPGPQADRVEGHLRVLGEGFAWAAPDDSGAVAMLRRALVERRVFPRAGASAPLVPEAAWVVATLLDEEPADDRRWLVGGELALAGLALERRRPGRVSLWLDEHSAPPWSDAGLPTRTGSLLGPVPDDERAGWAAVLVDTVSSPGLTCALARAASRASVGGEVALIAHPLEAALVEEALELVPLRVRRHHAGCAPRLVAGWVTPELPFDLWRFERTEGRSAVTDDRSVTESGAADLDPEVTSLWAEELHALRGPAHGEEHVRPALDHLVASGWPVRFSDDEDARLVRGLGEGAFLEVRLAREPPHLSFALAGWTAARSTQVAALLLTYGPGCAPLLPFA